MQSKKKKSISKDFFSDEWEQIYSLKNHNSTWPWTDLISIFYKNCSSLIKKDNKKVLELGCGAGANIPFFESIGFEYFGVDGSKTAVKNLIKKYPNLKDNILVADFSENIPAILGSKFDLIIDRASITHNNTKGIKKTLNIVRSKMSQHSYFIGIDWFASEHSAYKLGKLGDDKFTRDNLPSYTEFFKTGNVHFSSKSHLKSLFNNFKLIALNKKKLESKIPNKKYTEVKWDIVAKKKILS